MGTEALPGIALIVLIAAASFGIFLAYRHVSGSPPALSTGVMHGLGGALAVLLLVVSLFRGELHQREVVALMFLGVTLVAGGFLHIFHRKGRQLPNLAISVHGGLALIGITLLVIELMQ